MVTVTRDGTLIQTEELSAEQRESRVGLQCSPLFLRQHPDVVNTGGQDAAEPSTSSA